MKSHSMREILGGQAAEFSDASNFWTFDQQQHTYLLEKVKLLFEVVIIEAMPFILTQGLNYRAESRNFLSSRGVGFSHNRSGFLNWIIVILSLVYSHKPSNIASYRYACQTWGGLSRFFGKVWIIFQVCSMFDCHRYCACFHAQLSIDLFDADFWFRFSGIVTKQSRLRHHWRCC